jgi:hypothetical protein
MPLVYLQNFPNDLVTDSPHLGRARSAPTPSDHHGGSRPTEKRPLEDQKIEGAKHFYRGEEFGRGRGRGNRGGIDRFSS